MTYKYGDMVYNKKEGGTYMVVGPYIGERKKNDPKGPAVWVADVDTTYMAIGDGGTVWIVISDLEPADD